MINSTISPTTQKIATSTNVSSAGINGNHALLVAKSQFTTTPTTSSVGKIHQSVSFCSRVITMAAGASSHVMAYCAIMNKNASPSSTQKKMPKPDPPASGTSSIRMYILYFLPIRLTNSLRTHSGAGCVRSVSFVGRKANRNKWKGAGFPRQASRNRRIRCLSRISSAFLAYHEARLHGSPLFRGFPPLFQKRQTPPHHVRRGSARKHQKLRDISYLE